MFFNKLYMTNEKIKLLYVSDLIQLLYIEEDDEPIGMRIPDGLYVLDNLEEKTYNDLEAIKPRKVKDFTKCDKIVLKKVIERIIYVKDY